MSDFYGAPKLKDWLAEEVFDVDTNALTAEVIALFEEWREAIEANIQSWMESDDGDGNRLSWRSWGRGFYAIADADQERFEALVQQGKTLLMTSNAAPAKAAAESIVWTLDEALAFIRQFQQDAMNHGFYLALAGGVLNNGYSAKDLDLVAVPRSIRSGLAALHSWLTDVLGDIEINEIDNAHILSGKYHDKPLEFSVPKGYFRRTIKSKHTTE
jgi:hypothetical protein